MRCSAAFVLSFFLLWACHSPSPPVAPQTAHSPPARSVKEAENIEWPTTVPADMRAWFLECGITLPAEPPTALAAAAKASVVEVERILGDGNMDGFVSWLDLWGLWAWLTIPDNVTGLDLDLLDINRDGNTNWDDLGLFGDYLFGSGDNPYRISFLLEGLSSEFDIEVVFHGARSRPGYDLDDTHRKLFRQAASEWQKVIIGDLPDRDYTSRPLDTNDIDWWPGSRQEKYFERIVTRGHVDDVRVYVVADRFEDDMWGRAGALWYRTSGGFPITGWVALSTGFLAEETDEDVILSVMIHELGHVLGFGGITWDRTLRLSSWNHPGRDTYFPGKAARAAFLDAGGYYRRNGVPVENQGTGRDAHWRESILDHEVMTPFFDTDGRMPLSLITIQALADMGYEVDPSQADPYRVPSRAKPVAGEPRWRCGVGVPSKVQFAP